MRFALADLIDMSAEVVPCRLVELVCRSTELLVTIVAQYIKSRVPEQHMSGQFRDGNRILKDLYVFANSRKAQ